VALVGVGWQAALVAGLTLAMSSTAIVVQSLNERGLMKTSAGRATFAVLLFQDVAVIPIFALLPLLAMQPAPTEEATALASLPGWAQTIAVLGAVALIVLAGRYLMQPLFRWVAGTHVREIFVIHPANALEVGHAALGQQVEIIDQPRHGRIVAVRRLGLQRETFGEISSAYPGRIEALDEPERLLDDRDWLLRSFGNVADRHVQIAGLFEHFCDDPSELTDCA